MQYTLSGTRAAVIVCGFDFGLGRILASEGTGTSNVVQQGQRNDSRQQQLERHHHHAASSPVTAFGSLNLFSGAWGGIVRVHAHNSPYALAGGWHYTAARSCLPVIMFEKRPARVRTNEPTCLVVWFVPCLVAPGFPFCYPCHQGYEPESQ